MLPCAYGSVKLSGKVHAVRVSDQIRREAIPSAEREQEHRNNLHGETGDLCSAKPQQEQDDIISAAFLGFVTFRHHVQKKQKANDPRESSFPISPKYIDVVSRRFSTLDVFQECQNDDYLIVVGDWQLPGSLTSVTQVIIKNNATNGIRGSE